MGSKITGYAFRGSQTINRVEVNMDLKALEELPNTRTGASGVYWTREMDDALLAHWKRARKEDVARIIGVAEDTARKRYRFLTRGKT
jgi:hypothetical protein